MNTITYAVAGEPWATPLTARTAYSVSDPDVTVSIHDFRSDVEPLPLRSVVERLVVSATSRYVIVLRAGVFADTGFREAVEQFIGDHAPMLAMGYCANHDDGPAACTIVDRDRCRPSALHCNKAEEIPVDVMNKLRETALDGHDEGYRMTDRQEFGTPVFVSESGVAVFDELSMVADRVSLEAPVRMLSPAELRAHGRGWVYNYNTETPRSTLGPQDVRTILAVGAGIKAWHLAARQSASLEHLIVVDRNPTQLLFAARVAENLYRSTSWSALVGSLGMRGNRPTEHRRVQHEDAFLDIQKLSGEANYQTHYLLGDLLTQTFRIVDIVSRYPAPVLVWYSNLFSVYTKLWILRHPALHRSFLGALRNCLSDGVFLDSRD